MPKKEKFYSQQITAQQQPQLQPTTVTADTTTTAAACNPVKFSVFTFFWTVTRTEKNYSNECKKKNLNKWYIRKQQQEKANFL